jgi:predicted cytidylate kinase
MEKKHIITIGGLPGSGKSTAKAILAKELGWKTFSTGDFMRNMALQRGISFDEFNALIAKDKTIDEAIDAEQIRIGKEENNYIIDAHIGFHFIPNSFKVFLTLPITISAQRIFNDSEKETRKSIGDTMASVTEAQTRIQVRIDNHNDRYMRHYNVSPYNTASYDLVIDTQSYPPEEVAQLIIEAYNTWLQ